MMFSVNLSRPQFFSDVFFNLSIPQFFSDVFWFNLSRSQFLIDVFWLNLSRSQFLSDVFWFNLSRVQFFCDVTKPVWRNIIRCSNPGLFFQSEQSTILFSFNNSLLLFIQICWVQIVSC